MLKKYLESNIWEGIGRCSDMIWFSFGKDIFVTNYRNQVVKKTEYALHVQCSWRISKESTIILGNNDVYSLVDNSIEDDWDISGNNMFDKMVNDKILPLLPIKVLGVVCNKIGDIEITFETGIVINIFVNSSEPIEEWRFINNLSGEHLVYRDY